MYKDPNFPIVNIPAEETLEENVGVESFEYDEYAPNIDWTGINFLHLFILAHQLCSIEATLHLKMSVRPS